MKAKRFKKLRAELKSYSVMPTYGLFGDFDGFRSLVKHSPVTVMALSPENAWERAKRRGVGLDKHVGPRTKSSQFAHWEVKELNKPDTFRNTYYF